MPNRAVVKGLRNKELPEGTLGDILRLLGVGQINSPTDLMSPLGMASGPFRVAKTYAEQRFPKGAIVKVGDDMVDAVKGLNRGHAEYMARKNWPGADVEPIISFDPNKVDEGELDRVMQIIQDLLNAK